MLTERHIQLLLYNRSRAAAKIIVPNYTPRHWWEADLWVVSAAGYVTEYEIKLTIEDFRADAMKSKRVRRDGVFEEHRKHLRMGDVQGPSRFYYVVPEALVEVVRPELPEWAGLISAVRPTNRDGRPGHWSRTILMDERTAPRLHRVKVGESEIDRARVSMTYRYWNALWNAQKS